MYRVHGKTRDDEKAKKLLGMEDKVSCGNNWLMQKRKEP